ncbi:hypothetical protein [Streptomyces lonarensis]|uniref:Transcriptional regulator, AbiEi antitoxin, Type IV TA system n=1 Tax=Streptomyces lonarensis TaxID=700599 RepID=A0A7X6D3L1_9ACTN|nr:hypothetical protein [Streptomyces lonarensis]NJQ07388.1 hypothetical protein [Streptomyces lonarensis]
MTHDASLSHRPHRLPADAWHRVMTLRDLHAHGVSAAEARRRSAPGGDWQQPAPGVFLLHDAAPRGEELLLAARRYAEAEGGAEAGEQPALLTGMSALALYGFRSAPRPALLDRADLLVPHASPLAATGRVGVTRCGRLPRPVAVDGFALAPPTWAVADAVAPPTDPAVVREVLVEAVTSGRCDAAAVVRELGRARLRALPHVDAAIGAMVAAGRRVAEDRLLALVRDGGLPDPLWNVRLRLPGGPQLGSVDAYWPDHAVAVRLDTRTARRDAAVERVARERREALERLGVAVVSMTPRQVAEEPGLRASMVRTALLAATTRPPAAYVTVLPR